MYNLVVGYVIVWPTIINLCDARFSLFSRVYGGVWSVPDARCIRARTSVLGVRGSVNVGFGFLSLAIVESAGWELDDTDGPFGAN